MDIDRCPHCKSTGGYYIKVVFTQELHCGWEGPGDGFDDASNPIRIKGGKRQFCSDCSKDVTKFIAT